MEQFAGPNYVLNRLTQQLGKNWFTGGIGSDGTEDIRV